MLSLLGHSVTWKTMKSMHRHRPPAGSFGSGIGGWPAFSDEPKPSQRHPDLRRPAPWAGPGSHGRPECRDPEPGPAGRRRRPPARPIAGATPPTPLYPWVLNTCSTAARCACSRPSRRSARSNGPSSSPVPSAAPSVRPTRRGAAVVAADSSARSTPGVSRPPTSPGRPGWSERCGNAGPPAGESSGAARSPAGRLGDCVSALPPIVLGKPHDS